MKEVISIQKTLQGITDKSKNTTQLQGIKMWKKEIDYLKQLNRK